LFSFTWKLAAGKTGPGEHMHVGESETFTVCAGVIQIWVAGVRHVLREGDSLTVPAGVPHRFLNPGPDEVVVAVRLSGTGMEDTLLPMTTLTDADGNIGIGALPRVLVHVAEASARGATVPNSRVFRVVFGAIAAFFHLLGARPPGPVSGWDTRPVAD
jgi:hypothetical protein